MSNDREASTSEVLHFIGRCFGGHDVLSTDEDGVERAVLETQTRISIFFEADEHGNRFYDREQTEAQAGRPVLTGDIGL